MNPYTRKPTDMSLREQTCITSRNLCVEKGLAGSPSGTLTRLRMRRRRGWPCLPGHSHAGGKGSASRPPLAAPQMHHLLAAWVSPKAAHSAASCFAREATKESRRGRQERARARPRPPRITPSLHHVVPLSAQLQVQGSPRRGEIMGRGGTLSPKTKVPPPRTTEHQTFLPDPRSRASPFLEQSP